MRENLIQAEVGERFPDYLSDESRRVGAADSISFPKSEAEVRESMLWASEHGQLVTIQCGLTGIAGGATPDGGHILNLSQMNHVLGMRFDADGRLYVTVEPGVTLNALSEALQTRAFDTGGWSDSSCRALDHYRQGDGFAFPPDLTESGACFAGVVANNGSGARPYRYGPTRPHVSALRVMLMDGDVIALGREGAGGYAPFADERRFALHTESGRILEGELPGYTMPTVKNAAGIYAADDMALLDLFVGSEGTLGVITEIEVQLTPLPPMACGITAFLPSEEAALAFVQGVRSEVDATAAIEFFSAEALDLLRSQRETNPAFKELPELLGDWNTAIYVELHGDNDTVEQAIAALSDLMVACGGDPDATWFAESARDIERFKGVRHAVPEAVNLLIADRKKGLPELTKLGTDLSVPDKELNNVMAMYHRDLRAANLEYVIFGHIGNNHVHVNILPRNLDEYAAGKKIYLDWARRVVAMGGSVSAEHGIGKLKTGMLEIMYGAEGIDEMRAVKRVFDPSGTLNRGTLFAWEEEGVQC